MAILASKQAPLDLYFDVAYIFNQNAINLKQRLFFTDVVKFVTRGLNVSYDNSTFTLTVTKGAGIVNDVLVVLTQDITLTLDSSVNSQCAAVVLYFTNSPPYEANVLVIDAVDLANIDPMLYLPLACLSYGSVVFPSDYLTNCCGIRRINFDNIWNILDKIDINIAASTTTIALPFTLTTTTNIYDNVYVYLNGILLTFETDYVYDSNTNTITFTDPLKSGDVLTFSTFGLSSLSTTYNTVKPLILAGVTNPGGKVLGVVANNGQPDVYTIDFNPYLIDPILVDWTTGQTYVLRVDGANNLYIQAVTSLQFYDGVFVQDIVTEQYMILYVDNGSLQLRVV